MKFCNNCGKELFDEAILCPNCGTPVDEAAYSYVQNGITAKNAGSTVGEQTVTLKSENKKSYTVKLSIIALAVVFSACGLAAILLAVSPNAPADISGTYYYQRGLGYYSFDSNSETYNEFNVFGTSITGHGTYTYNHGTVQLDDGSEWIARELILIDKDAYNNYSSTNKVTVTSSGISGTVCDSYGDTMEFSNDGFCRYCDNVFAEDTYRYTVNDNGFVFIDFYDEFEVAGYLFACVYIPIDDTMISDDLY